MKRHIATVGFASLLAANYSCGPALDESEKWRQKFDAFTRTIDARMDALALAVPGEEYRRLINATHGPDGAAKTQAMAYVKSLFGVSMDQEFEASIWFEYNEPTELRADAFRAISPTVFEVEDWLRQGESYNPRPVASTQLPLTEAEVDQKVQAEFDSILAAAFGEATPVVGDQTGMGANVSEVSFSYGGQLVDRGPRRFSSLSPQDMVQLEPYKTAFPARVKANRAELARRLTLVTRLGRTQAMITDERRLHFKWALAEPARYVFVVVPKADFERHPSLKVKVLVHAVGNPSLPMARPIKELVVGDFRPDTHPLVNHATHGQAYWTAYNVTPQTTSVEGVAVFEEQEKARKRFAALIAARK